MDWRALARDKKLWIGVAAAGGVGLLVFLRRGGQAGGADAAAADVAGGGGIGYPGTLNTSGTDLAAALSNYSADLQGQLTEFGGTITDALKNIPTGSTPSPKPTTPPAGYGWYKVKKGDSLAKIAGSYQTNMAALRKLNPDILHRPLQTGGWVRVRLHSGTRPK